MVNLFLILLSTAWGLLHEPKYRAPRGFKLGEGYEERYYTQPIDHINDDPGVFSVKVLVREGHIDAPLFVYTGNEGPIEAFYELTGWLVDYLGPKYNATVAFIEHRYYGSSTFLPLDYTYLSTNQALLDFASITAQLKPKNTTKVVAFGGSYGGMLAAMFRMKYPFLVDGAIASSAPMLMAYDSGDGLMNQTSKAFAAVSEQCATDVFKSFEVLSNLVNRELYYPTIEMIFKPCQELSSPGAVSNLQNWLANAFESIAQFAYPYPATVYGPLPGYPVHTACSLVARAAEDKNVWSTLKGLYQVADLFYNGTRTETCFDINAGGGSDAMAWEYQTCTELLMPMGTKGYPNDMFYSAPWNYASFKSYCNATYGVTPRLLWQDVDYGLDMNYKSSLQYISNIAFSHGTEDPWNVGCFQEDFDLEKNLVIGIKGAAHHYDLRRPSTLDTYEVLTARKKEEDLIKEWTGLA